VQLVCQIGAYSDPARDPRFHTISVVFFATATSQPVAADDATEAGTFRPDKMPQNLVFDHARIIKDFFALRQKGLPSFCSCIAGIDKLKKSDCS
jgi:ADP-ribose pyrophosphatase YjhB (NUDIX family)